MKFHISNSSLSLLFLNKVYQKGMENATVFYLCLLAESLECSSIKRKANLDDRLYKMYDNNSTY